MPNKLEVPRIVRITRRMDVPIIIIGILLLVIPMVTQAFAGVSMWVTAAIMVGIMVLVGVVTLAIQIIGVRRSTWLLRNK